MEAIHKCGTGFPEHGACGEETRHWWIGDSRWKCLKCGGYTRAPAPVPAVPPPRHTPGSDNILESAPRRDHNRHGLARFCLDWTPFLSGPERRYAQTRADLERWARQIGRPDLIREIRELEEPEPPAAPPFGYGPVDEFGASPWERGEEPA